MGILSDIIAARQRGEKRLALLLDPEKAAVERLPLDGAYLPDYLLVGGSTGGENTDTFVRALRRQTALPIVLFPGSALQVSEAADALLFLSLLSGRNAELLVGEQVRAARRVRRSGLETIAMGYILIDGGVETSVQRVSGTKPLPQEDVDTIVDTAIAAELMGKAVVYLEAGSGAKQTVNTQIISAVRQEISLPLIVGGGIRTPQQMVDAWQAGADIVVIGNHFEAHPEDLAAFARAAAAFNKTAAAQRPQ